MSEPAQPLALLVEDDDAIAFLLRFLLQRLGCRVVAAKDGVEAMEAIESGEVARLVLLDMMLPVHDGLTLLGRLRSLPRWEGVPVVMLTAKGEQGFVDKAFAAGASDFVQKPFNPTELMERLKPLLAAA
ncbi:response regulator [Ramlibacter sp. USB13]|uniref:Response regulator n=1 Tax=Ramlibacter cellulosilyticus TaxID=2764187 RepID=A0A923SAI4_9BURK|nr:response regulator [Ramlibacter cellulosilyticus]MBC5782263.1 response regulator [Ramlibacter cellulosilyticus]